MTNLREAVSAWLQLDPDHRAEAILTPERPLTLGGATVETLSGARISELADRLSGSAETG